MSSYSSSIVLFARKNSNLQRIITASRFLNSRLQRVNLAFPVIRDAFAILGVLNMNADQYKIQKMHTIQSNYPKIPTILWHITLFWFC